MKMLIACLMLALFAAPAAGAAEEGSFEEAYGALLTNNLFVKDRRPPRQEREEPKPPPEEEAPPPPVPEKDWRLVGVVFEEGQFRAYLENAKERRIERFIPGDAVAAGVVGDVFIDGLSYVGVEGERWVGFGSDLTGAVTAAASPKSRKAKSEESARDKQLSLAERMRQRRQEEREQAEQNDGGRREWRGRRGRDDDDDNRERRGDDDDRNDQNDDGGGEEQSDGEADAEDE